MTRSGSKAVPVSIKLPLHEAVRLACEFSGRSRDEVYSAEYNSSRQIEGMPCEIAPFWRLEIAVSEASVDDDSGRSVGFRSHAGPGSIVVFEGGRVGTYEDLIGRPESENLVGRTGTMTDHPGVAMLDGESRLVEASRKLAPGASVVVVGVRKGVILLVEPDA